MKQNNLEKALASLAEEKASLEEQRKSKMLDQILESADRKHRSIRYYFENYPYRVAFSFSMLQTAIFTLIFGTRYFDFILSLFGG